MRCQKVMKIALFSLSMALAATGGRAQETNVAFAGLKTDVSQPVQIDADQLSVNQETGIATFSGNVIVVQGDMRLQAGEVTIRYSADNRDPRRRHRCGHRPDSRL
jgi:lipopolysaccharide export system protein LptA